MNFDACDDFSGDFRSGHLIILALVCSEDGEDVFGVMADVFMSRESFFHVIIFYLISFLFNCCLKF